jgi:hypothetical protein
MGVRALLVSGLLAAGLVMSTAGIVIAGPDADIRIEDPTGNEPIVGGTITVCEFHLVAIPGSDDHETGTWEIRDTGGGTVMNGDYETLAGQPDRVPDTGEFSLPEGSYMLAWDSEPIDRSHREKPFVVECGGVAPTASPSPAPTGTASPSPTGTGGGGGVLPTSGVNPTGGAPEVTLPPTDSGSSKDGASAPQSGAWSLAAALAVVAVLVFLATPRRVARTRRIDR